MGGACNFNELFLIMPSTKAPPKHCGWKICLSSPPVKSKKKFMKRAQNRRCKLQCVNKHCVKFEYKGMNTVGVTDYTN